VDETYGYVFQKEKVLQDFLFLASFLNQSFKPYVIVYVTLAENNA